MSAAVASPVGDTLAAALPREMTRVSDTEIGREMGRRPNSVRARMMTLARRDTRAEIYA